MTTRTRLSHALVLLALALVPACAPRADTVNSAAAPAREEVAWAFERSDVPLDPDFRFGMLPNGMRYVIRHNATPKGTALVRLEIETGSIDEQPGELGYAHFVEHMAFNGSIRVPEGEMVRLLERNGLAFGADTNASTGFDWTSYKLDLPRNDPALLDTALMLMRETASGLTFSADAVEREKGVVLAELRDRNDYQLRNAVAQAQFLYPDALYPKRFPIGEVETLRTATAEALKAFWSREYVPAHTTLIVIGDFDPALVEAEITRHFADWQAAQAGPQPGGGPVHPADKGRTQIHIDPALSERIVVVRHGPWLDEPDSVAQRQRNLLRQIGYNIFNRRLQSLSRQADPPFRGAGFGTGDVFEAGRSTRLIVDTADGKWRRGMERVALEYRTAMEFGFSEAEVAEQVANLRAALENAAASAQTRSNATLLAAINQLLREDMVPSHPATVLERFEEFVPSISPEAVLAALEDEAVPLDEPLLRFQGRQQPEGGEEAVRQAWRDAMEQPLTRGDASAAARFDYDDFGAPGAVISDVREPALGIRTIRFSNGVMLNLKTTDLEKERVWLKLSIDGGNKLDTRENPLPTQLMPYLAEGGLGRLSEDELQTILAGRTVSNEFATAEDTFTATTRTTARDLELQLRLLAAYLTDPGYRPEGEVQFRHQINTYFARLRATPNSALTADLGRILSDGDPRFTLQDIEAYRALTFADLRAAVEDRFINGAIEIGLVGDFDEERAIALVGQVFGALPSRERAFRTYDDQPPRLFTRDRARRILRHTGAADQALIRLTWPTRDDSDPVAATTLNLLERIVRIQLTETLRETLGKAYSPAASSSPSRYWSGYGTFAIAASVDVHEVETTREAIAQTLRALRDGEIDDDVMRRARQPMLETLDQVLKSNAGWLALVDRAQSESDRIDRYLGAKQRLSAISAQDVQAAAQRYLAWPEAVEILVLPEGADVPAG